MYPESKTFYKSRLIGKISSETLDELKGNLIIAAKRHENLSEQLLTHQKQLKGLKLRKKWLGWSPLSKLYSKKVMEWENEITQFEISILKTKEDLEKCKVEIEIVIDGNVEAGFGTLNHAFSEVQQSEKIWDITTSQMVDRVAQRTEANHTVERKPVKFGKSRLDIVRCDYESLHLQNANGADLYIFPLFIVMRDENDIALIDLRDVDLQFSLSKFIEEEEVPVDAEIIGQTWAKANKDGSRDKRFANNYQIPILKYGQIHLKTAQGLNEVYTVSNADALFEFSKVFNDYRELLSNQ